MSRLPLPITDYLTDTKGVLDNSMRILQAMIEVAAEAGWLATALGCMQLVQCVMQGRWPDDNPLLMLPHVDEGRVEGLGKTGFRCVCERASERERWSGVGWTTINGY